MDVVQRGPLEHWVPKFIRKNNRKLDLTGYELLFRGGTENEALVASAEGATATVVLNSLTEFGLERIVGAHTATPVVSSASCAAGVPA